MRTHLTDMAVQKFSLPSSGQVTHWDTNTRGFGVRCSTKSKSFVVMFGEKRRLKTLGRYPAMSLSDARIEAKRFFVEYTDDPLSIEPSISFEDARDAFIKDAKVRNKERTANDYERLLKRHFKFEGDLRDLTRKQVMKALSRLSATPSEQSHAFVAIRIMMNWCVRQGYLEHSIVPPMSQRSNARNHVLTENELRQVFLKARETPYPFGPIVQLLILTGQRRGEVASMRRSWLDSDGYMTFPEGFTKNKREHRFPLSTMAQEVLASLPNTGDLFFPATGSTEKPFNGWGKCKARLDAQLDTVQPYTLHDLRRTFATIHAKIGTPIHITERLLNHISGTISGVAAVYNRHSYQDEMAEAMANYDEFVHKLDLK